MLNLYTWFSSFKTNPISRKNIMQEDLSYLVLWLYWGEKNSTEKCDQQEMSDWAIFHQHLFHWDQYSLYTRWHILGVTWKLKIIKNTIQHFPFILSWQISNWKKSSLMFTQRFACIMPSLAITLLHVYK